MPQDRHLTFRKYPRFVVNFPVALATSVFECDGTVLNLSLGGCRLESEIEVAPREYLSLRLYLSYHEAPVVIKTAVVRWVCSDSHECGVEFLVIEQEQRDLLQRFLNAYYKKNQ